MNAATVVVSLRVSSRIAACVGIGVLATSFLIVRECSSFSLGQNTGVTPSGSSYSPIFSATIDEIDGDIATPYSDDDGSVGLFPNSLFQAADLACIPKSVKTEAGGGVRYEWGRWVDDDAVAALMEELNEIGILQGSKVYDRLLELPKPTSPSLELDDEKTVDEQENIESDNEEDTGRRFRVSGGDNWDCILHVLPKGMEWRGRWPTGSWAMVRTLTGMAEMNLMRGPDRDGFFKKATTAKLRGGGDGTLGGGAGGRGEDGVKYVGGALRSYSGVGGKTMLLEVVIRPPMGQAGIDGDGHASIDIEPFPAEDTIIAEIAKENSIVEKDPTDLDETGSQDDELAQIDQHVEEEKEEPNTNLGAKMGLAFDKVGGLDDQLNDIVRRVLASR